MSTGVTERGPVGEGSAPNVIVGNVYDKYGTRNPVARLLMSGFLDAVMDLATSCRPRTVLEVGCGEGKLSDLLAARGLGPDRFVACDVSIQQVARDVDPRVEFREASIYELPFEDDSFDLVVCCEVLEHLDEPRRGLSELRRVAGKRLLVSTPREPLWRAMNVLRGKYWRELGNTPGHVQHFSGSALVQLVESEARVLARRNPIPWTVLLAEPHGAQAAL